MSVDLIELRVAGGPSSLSRLSSGKSETDESPVVAAAGEKPSWHGENVPTPHRGSSLDLRSCDLAAVTIEKKKNAFDHLDCDASKAVFFNHCDRAH